jgi:glycosyltransferase involved in cell wall biosynthesis
MSNTIGNTIESIIDNRDYPDKEIIVVLDGKDDDAERIVKMFPDIKLLSTGDTNKGAPYARNLGAKEATGDYLLFLDADMRIYPGTLRAWAEAFDEHPECDFVYAGYKFINVSAFPSEEFDPYFLKINNYIDGNFPMKREIFPQWDESLKSLQDWDMWLTIVEKGHKGHFIPRKYFFEKEYPKPGSISAMGSEHYLERREIVMKKHNCPVRDICLTSFAAIHHAKRVAKVLNYDYADWEMLYNKPYKYKAIYLIGNFPANANNNMLPFMDIKTNLMRKDIKRVLHWIGTDVWQLQNETASFAVMKKYVEGLNKNFIQFCQSDSNRDELVEMGVNVKTLPMPIEIEQKTFPMPKDFTVSIYDHGTNKVYCQNLMDDIIMAMPDINFNYFGADTQPINWWTGSQHDNLMFLGRLPIDEVIKKTSVLLRISQHDGYPVSPIEFVCAGRACITNQNVPYTFRVGDVKIDQNNLPVLRKEIITKIRELRREYPPQQYFDEAVDHFKNVFNPDVLRAEIERGIQ